MSRQHHKGMKRLRSWHRGQSEARNWDRLQLPDTGTSVAPSGEPQPIHRNRRTGKQQRGDAY